MLRLSFYKKICILLYMFSKKIEYFNIIIKSKEKNEIKLSLLKNKPIIEAIQEFNSHIQDKNEHITKLFVYNNNMKLNINMELLQLMGTFKK